ncbi:MAG: DNA-directed RNA polymerase subunit omega [Deltaproteobacteria bacterium RIFCSPHIGHO2_12_FULL_43_9]|nr:MAG: DNA-directed RNA polymerase subunit omega [Deltaproteobacteria bacterium RIFCSPHIGHO2_12_FULL_43_9]
MARVTVEDCLKNVRNRFELVHVAVKRTKQILKGSRPLIDAKNKPPVLALREIAEGFVKPVDTDIDSSSEGQGGDGTSISD